MRTGWVNLTGQIAQHIVENAAVLVIVELIGGVDPNHGPDQHRRSREFQTGMVAEGPKTHFDSAGQRGRASSFEASEPTRLERHAEEARLSKRLQRPE